jgi:hypothetical protein
LPAAELFNFEVDSGRLMSEQQNLGCGAQEDF